MSIEVSKEDQELFQKIVAAAREEEADAEFLEERMAPRKARKEHVRKRLIHRTSILLAKAAGDPLYDKYVLFASRVREIRGQLLKKYQSKAKSVAMKSMANRKK